MQFVDFKEKLRDFKVFNLNDIRKNEAGFDLRRLSEWTGKGYIKNIRRGYYVFSDLKINDDVLLMIANKIYAPSYVSFEMALSRHNLIPEAVYAITSATTQKTNSFQTFAGSFIYKRIKPELMFGYELRARGEFSFAIAEMEKAVLDYLYLNSDIKSGNDFGGLRFNIAEFKARADIKKFDRYAAAFGSKALSRRAKSFLNFIKNA